MTKSFEDLFSEHRYAGNSPEESVIFSTVIVIDHFIEGLISRPVMMAGGSTRTAELLMIYLLKVRAMLSMSARDVDTWSTKPWVDERYPHIPGPVRCIESCIHGGYSEDVPYREAFDQSAWEEEATALFNWAKGKMGG